MFGLSLIRTSALKGIAAAAEGLNEELASAAVLIDAAEAQVETCLERIERDGATIGQQDTEIRRLTAELDALAAEASGRVALIFEAVQNPERGETFRAGIALTILRRYIACVRETGTSAEQAEVYVLDVILGDEPDHRRAAKPASSAPRGGATTNPKVTAS